MHPVDQETLNQTLTALRDCHRRLLEIQSRTTSETAYAVDCALRGVWNEISQVESAMICD